LGRTRELTIKDLWNGGKYKLVVAGRKGYAEQTIEMESLAGKEDNDEDGD